VADVTSRKLILMEPLYTVFDRLRESGGRRGCRASAGEIIYKI
jgi:hypothetical protein